MLEVSFCSITIACHDKNLKQIFLLDLFFYLRLSPEVLGLSQGGPLASRLRSMAYLSLKGWKNTMSFQTDDFAA